MPSILGQALRETRRLCYDSSGRYKGIHLIDDELRILGEFVNDNVNVIAKILNWTSNQGFLIRNSREHHSLLTSNDEDSNGFDMNDDGDLDTSCPMSMGAEFGKECVQLSQRVLTRERVHEFWKKKLHDILPYVKTEDDLEKLDELISDHIHTLSGVKGSMGDVYGYLGERGTKEKRTLYQFEK
jgi:hypothetical protein